MRLIIHKLSKNIVKLLRYSGFGYNKSYEIRKKIFKRKVFNRTGKT